LVQQWGWEMLAYPSYSPNLTPCDYWLRARAKECVWGNWFESEDDIDTAVIASLHHLSMDEYRAAVDHLPHRWKKCVDIAGDYDE